MSGREPIKMEFKRFVLLLRVGMGELGVGWGISVEITDPFEYLVSMQILIRFE